MEPVGALGHDGGYLPRALFGVVIVDAKPLLGEEQRGLQFPVALANRSPNACFNPLAVRGGIRPSVEIRGRGHIQAQCGTNADVPLGLGTSSHQAQCPSEGGGK